MLQLRLSFIGLLLQESANNYDSLAPVRFSFFSGAILYFFLIFIVDDVELYFFSFLLADYIRSDSFIGHQNIHIMAFQDPKKHEKWKWKCRNKTGCAGRDNQRKVLIFPKWLRLFVELSTGHCSQPSSFSRNFHLQLNFKLRSFFSFSFLAYVVDWLVGWMDSWLVSVVEVFHIVWIKFHQIILH